MQARVGRLVLLAGALIYVISWFQRVHGIMADAPVPGWDAFLVSVWPYGGGWNGSWYAGLHWVASALTNFALVGALAVFLVARRTPSRGAVTLLIACAVLNTHWYVLPGEVFTPLGGTSQFRDNLEIGYYLWVGSFFLVAAGALLLRAARTRPSSSL